MKKQTIILLAVVVGLIGTVQAEFGISGGASFNCKASFRSASRPGAAAAGTDHTYDDGYNRVDSSGNAGNLTTYWGYQNASQYDPTGDGGNGTISMHSVRDSSETQDDAQPTIELYWQHDFTENENWNLGIRTALSWQHIEIDSKSLIDTDTYSLGGVLPPGAPFDGSFSGPNVMLSDILARSTAAGATRNIDADLFGLKVGPTLSLDLTEKIRATVSAGGTAAWIRSDFSYRNGIFASGKDREEDWLFGAYAGADLQYQVGEHWGIFAGVSYIYLNDFEQRAGNQVAELDFSEGYTLRSGLFFR